MPLRFPRPAMAIVATGTAVITIGLSAMPASADQVRHSEWWLSSLGVTSAWPATQGSGVTIAVLSDGVNAHQADLASAVTTAPHLPGAPVASGQYFGEQGTAIASLIAGRGHATGGNSGISGVAPEARILSVPVTLPADDPELAQTSVAAAIPGAIAAGIDYAVKHGATVIDLPIDPGQPGTAGTGGVNAAAGGSAAEQAAVKKALARGVVLVAPAGDNGAGADAVNYPAAYPGVIAVGAFDSAFNKAPWSSRQSYVTLTAAGENVNAASAAGGYQPVNSTSAASAIVAGVAALIRSRYPALSATQVRQAMTSSTMYRRAGGLADGSGYGAVNADKALQAAARLAIPVAPRAGAKAQPLVAPAAVAAASSTGGITHQILRAAEVSGALLLALLLLVGGYALTGRRRSRRGPEVAAQWTPRLTQSRYPHSSPAEDDRMLALFSAPAIEHHRLGGPATILPGRVISDDQAYSSGFGPAGADPGVGPRPAGPDSGRLVSPASRAVSRQPLVSGSPPWEPAASPDGELPWAAAPGRQSVIGGRPAIGPAMGSPAVPALPASRPGQAPWDASPAGEPAYRPAAQPDYDDNAAPDWASTGPRQARPVLGGAAGYIAASRGGARSATQFPGTQFPETQFPETQFAETQAAETQFPETQAAETSFAETRFPGTRFRGAQFEATQAQAGQRAGLSATGDGPANQDWPSQPDARRQDGLPSRHDDAWPLPQRAAASPAAQDLRPSWPEVPQEPLQVAPSGLPVRTPRQPTPAPLSPSGSLWDPVDRESSSYRDSRSYPAQDTSYTQPGSYQDPASYGEPSSYGQPASYGDGEGSYARPASYGEGGYAQPGSYGEGSYAESASYDEEGRYASYNNEAASNPAGPANATGRLMYSWEQPAQEQTDSFPSLPAEPRRASADWGIPE